MYACAVTVHLIAAIIWIGGMFFAYMCLRPSLPETLEPAQAAALLAAAFGRFFRWVWAAVALLLSTGSYMTLARYDLNQAPAWLYAMMALGITMVLLFAHIYFAPFQRLKAAIAAGESSAVRPAIGQIRVIVGINLALGLLVTLSVSIGRFV